MNTKDTKNVNLKLTLADHRLLKDMADMEFIPITSLLRKLYLTHARDNAPEAYKKYLNRKSYPTEQKPTHKKPSSPTEVDTDLEGIDFDE